MRKYIIVLIYGIFLFACREDYDLELEGAEPVLVIDGMILNHKGPHFVRLSKSLFSANKDTNYLGYEIEKYADPVNDALVIVKDNIGTVDTLNLIDSTFFESKVKITWDGYSKTEYFYTVEQYNGRIDTNFIDIGSFTANNLSIYYTQKIQGKPGVTYTLEIHWRGDVYTSTETMPEPVSVDSASYRIDAVGIGKDDNVIPLLYFFNPSEINPYYLTCFSPVNFLHEIFSHNGGWIYSTIDTRFFGEYINGLFLEDGYNEEYWRSNYGPSSYYDFETETMRYFYDVSLFSIPVNVYDYYSQVSAALNGDGGAYRPTPATPYSNISNEALGCFIVGAKTQVVIPVNSDDMHY